MKGMDPDPRVCVYRIRIWLRVAYIGWVGVRGTGSRPLGLHFPPGNTAQAAKSNNLFFYRVRAEINDMWPEKAKICFENTRCTQKSTIF